MQCELEFTKSGHLRHRGQWLSSDGFCLGTSSEEGVREASEGIFGQRFKHDNFSLVNRQLHKQNSVENISSLN